MANLRDKKIIRVTQERYSLMTLTWLVNNICNNKCSYCTPELFSGKGHHYKWENAKKFLEILFERYPEIHCSVSGGEPTISHFFPELVKLFNDHGHSIGVTSNGFKPLEYWKSISERLSSIDFSYHPEFPVKDFKEKVIVSSINTFVGVRIMMLPSRWNHCIEVFNSLKDIDTCCVYPIRILDRGGNREDHLYTKEQLDWFQSEEVLINNQKTIHHLIERDVPLNLISQFEMDDGSILSGNDANPSQFLNLGMTNFRGYTCEAGLKSLFIQPTGEIYLSNCSINGSIGQINDPENINWPIGPVICDVDVCPCATDISINKWSN